MFNTFEEVLLHVKSQFKNTDELSKNESSDCFYANEINGIGCAIGCCVTHEDAKLLDMTGTIITEYKNDRYKELQWGVLRKYFSDDISKEDLSWLQLAHDGSETVEEFIGEIDKKLDELSPNNSYLVHSYLEFEYV